MRKGLRTSLLVADVFAAATAIGGGLALAAGLEDGRFPLEWLRGTPFASYVVPGAILAVAVGGSAAIATAGTLRDDLRGGRLSMLAGAILAGWIAGEVAILRADGEFVSPTEAFYGALAVAMVGLGFALQRLAPNDARPGEGARRTPEPGAG